jgi:long-chain-fatty-acid--[acyl-carrier-protein] ligase
MLPASVAAPVVYLATVFAGKIPVMVNWTVGTRNMTASLDLLGVKRILTAARLVEKLGSQGLDLGDLQSRFVLLEELGASVPKPAKIKAALRARLGWSGLQKATVRETAVVLFTSGSESLPKAVPLTHRNFLTNIHDVTKVLRFNQQDKLIGVLPPFHSFGITGTLLLPLCAGIPVVYHPNPTEGGVVARLIEAYKVTLLIGTPTFLAGIVRAADDDKLKTLRVVVSGAEKCPLQLYETIAARWPQMKVVEGYGITECSPVVSANREEDLRPGTIGKIAPSVEYAIQDVETGLRAEKGRAGMLLVRGPSIFGGYLNYKGPSPFVEFEGKEWYRTGDLVSEAPDGVLTFSGRLKRFVKLGGEMISLPAIEEVLARFYVTENDEKPVLAVEATPQELNPELVLFTIRDIEREEANQRLREGGLSPIYNIRRVVRIDEIPVLGTGKTNYRALKDLLKAAS